MSFYFSCATLEEKVKELQKVELKDFIHFAFQCLDTDIEICFFDDPDREKGNRMLFTGGYFNPLATDDLMNKLRNSGVFDDIKVGFIGTIKDDAFELVEICVEEIAKKVVQRIKSQIYKEEPSGDENDESQKRGSGRSLRSHDRSQTVDLTEDDREAGAGDEDSEISSLLFYEVATSDLHEPGTVDETVVEFWNGTEAIMVHKSYDVEFMDFWLLTSEFDGFPQDKIELPSLNAMKKEFEIMKRKHRKGIKEPSSPAEPRRISMKEVSSAIASAFEETHEPKKPQQPRHSQDHRQKSRPGGSQGTSQSSQSSFTIVSANPKNPVTRRRIPTSFQQARALDRLTHNIKNASSSTSPSMYEKVFEGENVEIIEPDREPDDNDVVVVDDDNKGHSDENNNQPENQQRQKKKKKLFFMVNP